MRVVSAHLLLPDDLDADLPPIDRDWQGFEDDAIGPRANRVQRRRFIEEVFRRINEDDVPASFERMGRAVGEPGARPQLLFLHASIPHVPWHYTPEGKRYETRVSMPGVVDGTWVGSQWLADQGFQRHLLQTQYADKLLGDLLRRLRETGVYDRALMVVLADHGVSFRSGDRRRRPTPTNVHDVANMPLFIKLPGQREGDIKDTAVRTIDVLPTIADELGLRLREPVDGVPVGERDADPDNEIDVPDSWELGTTTDFGTHPAPARGAAALRALAARGGRLRRVQDRPAAGPDRPPRAGDGARRRTRSSSRTRASSRTSTPTRRCCRSGCPAP